MKRVGKIRIQFFYVSNHNNFYSKLHLEDCAHLLPPGKAYSIGLTRQTFTYLRTPGATQDDVKAEINHHAGLNKQTHFRVTLHQKSQLKQSTMFGPNSKISFKLEPLNQGENYDNYRYFT
jgi:hypothetical protein